MVSFAHHSQVIHIPDLSDDKSGRAVLALRFYPQLITFLFICRGQKSNFLAGQKLQNIKWQQLVSDFTRASPWGQRPTLVQRCGFMWMPWI
jgi:hypothetical protein